MTEDQNEWTQIKQPERPTWKPTENGDEITGVLIEKQEDVGVNKARLYTLETKPGFKVNVWGKTILDELLQQVPVGAVVRIVFKGKVGKAFRYDTYTKNQA